MIIDDIVTTHAKSPDGDKGTQTLYFTNGVKVPLHSRAALMTCKASLPTLKEYAMALKAELPLVDIVILNWNPHRHNDDHMSISMHTQSTPTETQLHTEMTSFCTDDDQFHNSI